MEQLFTNLVGVMRDVPSPVIYLVAAVWMGLESAGIGVPIEPLMLFLGSLSTRVGGNIVNPVGAVAACTIGCVAFASLAYAIGRREGTGVIARRGRFVGLNQQRADHFEVWLRRKGGVGVFVARLTPMVRTFGSFVMGAAEIPRRTFVLGTAAGSLLYCTIFVTIGALLGYERPLKAVDAVGWRGVAVVVGVVILYIVLHRLWTSLTLRRIRQHYRRYSKTATATAAPTTHG
jgi:membrane protein DedA with SNARE-associated domain